MISDKEIEAIEAAANVMRGVALDPRVPDEAKRVLREHAENLDRVANSAMEG